MPYETRNDVRRNQTKFLEELHDVLLIGTENLLMEGELDEGQAMVMTERTRNMRSEGLQGLGIWASTFTGLRVKSLFDCVCMYERWLKDGPLWDVSSILSFF